MWKVPKQRRLQIGLEFPLLRRFDAPTCHQLSYKVIQSKKCINGFAYCYLNNIFDDIRFNIWKITILEEWLLKTSLLLGISWKYIDYLKKCCFHWYIFYIKESLLQPNHDLSPIWDSILLKCDVINSRPYCS